jgi:hypothetical protein
MLEDSYCDLLGCLSSALATYLLSFECRNLVYVIPAPISRGGLANFKESRSLFFHRVSIQKMRGHEKQINVCCFVTDHPILLRCRLLPSVFLVFLHPMLFNFLFLLLHAE